MTGRVGDIAGGVPRVHLPESFLFFRAITDVSTDRSGQVTLQTYVSDRFAMGVFVESDFFRAQVEKCSPAITPFG